MECRMERITQVIKAGGTAGILPVPKSGRFLFNLQE